MISEAIIRLNVNAARNFLTSFPSQRTGLLPSLVDDHLGGFDNGRDLIAWFETKVFRRSACDTGNDFQITQGDDNFRHHPAELHGLNGAFEIISRT
jgi:hypothetical protein